MYYITLSIFSYLILNLLASILGFKEGILYSKKGADAFSWDEHDLYSIERVVIGIVFLLGTFFTITQALLLTLTWGLSFSFWHNGFYYISRNKIDVESYNFTSSSTTSTAKIELNWKIRLWLKIASVILFLFFFVYLPIKKDITKKHNIHFFKKQTNKTLNA